MDAATRKLAVAVRALARLLPADRRQWAEAVQAEAELVPAGRPRLEWMLGGLWIVLREAEMGRKIVYWLGVGAVATAIGWALVLSWRTSPSADGEAMTDRVRILVGAAALLGLPWAGRKLGWFGPVGNTITARMVRLGGCAAMCVVGIELVRLDEHAGRNGIGYGNFMVVRELTGLVLLGGVFAVPLAARRWWPRAETATLSVLSAMAAVSACVLVPVQTIVVLYIAGILAVTARRSSPSTILAGTLTGLVASPIAGGILLIPVSEAGIFPKVLVAVPVAVALLGSVAGLAAARRTTGIADPGQLRQAQIRQGVVAGLMTGAVAGMVLTLASVGMSVLLVVLWAAGLLGGAAGAAYVANHPPKTRTEGRRGTGLYIANS